jgi:hypothetical protein
MTLDRRHFLKAGSIALIGAAVAACTSKDKAKPGTPTTTTVPTTTSSGASPSDIALVKTAASLEALAVSVYQRAAAANLVKDPAALDTTTLFLSHHMAHQQALNAVLQTAEVPAITSPNGAVDKTFRQALAAAKTQDDVVDLLFTLEEAIAQTYLYATGVITKPEDRASLMTIAGVQARHRTLLGFVFGRQSIDDLFPTAFAKSDNPLPPDAILG